MTAAVTRSSAMLRVLQAVLIVQVPRLVLRDLPHVHLRIAAQAAVLILVAVAAIALQVLVLLAEAVTSRRCP